MSGRCRKCLILCLLAITCLLPVVPVAEENGATLNFRDVDIQALINYVSEETQTNFIVDPRVRGRVTLVSGRPVSRAELYEIFLSVLRVHGFAAVQTDGVIKLVPDAIAKQAEVPTASERSPLQGDEYVTRVISVTHVDAAQLVPILRPLIPQSGHLAASPESNTLVISDTAANVNRLVGIIGRIDQESREDMEVIPLQHAAAAEVARIISTMEGAEGRQRPGSRLQVMADERTNSILLSGDPKRRIPVRAVISHLDIPMEGGNTRVIYLRYAKAEDVAEVLRGLAASMEAAGGGGAGAGRGGSIHVQAHESTNAVVISAPPDVIRDMRAVIQQLDVRRAQVLVEAIIAEVSTERARELGVQWGIGSERDGVGIINFGSSGSGLYQLTRGFLAGGTDLPSLGDGLTLGGIGQSGGTTIATLIRALAGDSASNILSTPSLLTMDNEEAEIIVGQNVPFRSGRAIEQSGQAFDTIQRQDVGVKLTVRPQINEGNAVKLEIEQEVSQVAPRISGQDAADLITNKRSLRTSVMVDDGQMVVLGGLIDDVLVQTRNKVPGLGDIPGLGRLFRYDTSSKEKRNLMVFLHPVIIRDHNDMTGQTAAKYNYIRAEQLRSRAQGVLMMPDDTVPVLPDWEALLHLPPPFEASAAATVRGLSIQPPPGRQ
ncbi:type II secretion system secretin GspD [Ectothiorhodospira shaposhnikovii]|uniref:type II secretion system secretin GspD n=1 Tax=Ectothiorhodospira shaposhnikovii TaxID=1054 RepID=UPI001EE8D8D9|nr:type II secretion system secretin GspD [Ectothiorhodospira shaposhnikovii]MCG5512388.1 type II secretion system secretin GspD [Ectothiorhodospira shaposhnikovii]